MCWPIVRTLPHSIAMPTWAIALIPIVGMATTPIPHPIVLYAFHWTVPLGRIRRLPESLHRSRLTHLVGQWMSQQVA